MPRVVADALAERAANLARGIDPNVRPTDVARIAAHRPPVWHGVLSGADAERARSLIREAIDGLDVRIQKNLPERHALEALTTGGRLGNVFDGVGQRPWREESLDVQLALDDRIHMERKIDVWGTGTTIYGTVHFSDRTHLPMVDHSGVIRLRDVGLDAGARDYGLASIVLGRRAVENATFLAADTGVLGGIRPVRAREHLDDVVLEWMVDNFQLGTDPKGLERSFDNVFDRDLYPSRIAKDFRTILDLPRPKAVAAIQEHLTSDAVNTKYMEAQVRIADADDVVGVHLTRLRDSHVPPEHLPEYLATIDAIRAAGLAAGVPVRLTGDALGPARAGVGWIRGS